MKQIPLTQGLFAIVDPIDFEWLTKFKWHASGSNQKPYAARSDRKQMHRLIMGVTDSKVFVDHISGDTLDNRRENLRICNRSQNMMNMGCPKTSTTGWKGVSRLRKHGRWAAYITANYKRICLGSYDTPEDAARAFNEAAVIHHGEFARLNQVTPLFPSKPKPDLRIDNSSGFRGVSFEKRRGRWQAQIVSKGKNKFLGYFPTPEEAAAAYKAKAKELRGEFMRAEQV